MLPHHTFALFMLYGSWYPDREYCLVLTNTGVDSDYSEQAHFNAQSPDFPHCWLTLRSHLSFDKNKGGAVINSFQILIFNYQVAKIQKNQAFQRDEHTERLDKFYLKCYNKSRWFIERHKNSILTKSFRRLERRSDYET